MILVCAHESCESFSEKLKRGIISSLVCASFFASDPMLPLGVLPDALLGDTVFVSVRSVAVLLAVKPAALVLTSVRPSTFSVKVG